MDRHLKIARLLITFPAAFLAVGQSNEPDARNRSDEDVKGQDFVIE